jgi:hypothetical protein
VALGMVGIALFQTDTSYLQLVLTMCVISGGMALTMTPMTTQLMTSVPRDRAGMGSATNDTTRELGGARSEGNRIRQQMREATRV